MSLATTKNSEVVLSSRAHLFDAHRCEVLEAVSQGLHQVAQPMTVLQGVLELALLAPSTEEQYKRTLQRAMDQWQRVAASIDALRRSLHPEPCPRYGENSSTGASPQRAPEATEPATRCTRV